LGGGVGLVGGSVIGSIAGPLGSLVGGCVGGFVGVVVGLILGAIAGIVAGILIGAGLAFRGFVECTRMKLSYIPDPVVEKLVEIKNNNILSLHSSSDKINVKALNATTRNEKTHSQTNLENKSTSDKKLLAECPNYLTLITSIPASDKSSKYLNKQGVYNEINKTTTALSNKKDLLEDEISYSFCSGLDKQSTIPLTNEFKTDSVKNLNNTYNEYVVSIKNSLDTINTKLLELQNEISDTTKKALEAARAKAKSAETKAKNHLQDLKSELKDPPKKPLTLLKDLKNDIESKIKKAKKALTSASEKLKNADAKINTFNKNRPLIEKDIVNLKNDIPKKLPGFGQNMSKNYNILKVLESVKDKVSFEFTAKGSLRGVTDGYVNFDIVVNFGDIYSYKQDSATWYWAKSDESNIENLSLTDITKDFVEHISNNIPTLSKVRPPVIIK
jgi:F0F1-type ATP synthase membrane subunit b/b'